MSALAHLGEHPLAELVLDPQMRLFVGQRLADVVLASFGTDRMRDPFAKPPTVFEVKFRTAIAIEWFKVLRKDMKYSLERTLDLLPQALRAKLDGIDFEPPPPERMWAGGGAAKSLTVMDEVLHDGSKTCIDRETGSAVVGALPELPRDHESKD